MGHPPPRRRHLLPHALAALHARLRRAGRQHRGKPVPAGQRPPGRVERGGAGHPAAPALHRGPLARECRARPDRTHRPPAAAGGAVDAGSLVPDRPRRTRCLASRTSSGSCAARDAPVSAVETHMRYMPCGKDRGSEAAERTRTARFHRSGLAALTYLREAVCATYREPFSEGVRNRLFIKRADGTPYTYSAFVGGRTTAIGQIDFGAPEPRRYTPAPRPRRRQRLRRLDGGLRRVHATRLAVLQRARRMALPQPLPGALPPLGPALRRPPAPPDRALHPLRLDRGCIAAPRSCGAATPAPASGSTGWLVGHAGAEHGHCRGSECGRPTWAASSP